MKKIIYILFVVFITISCDRDLEFETKTTTEPALEVQVEGVAVNNTHPKIEGATVELFNNNEQLLATATTNAGGRVCFTKDQLKEKGIFSVKAAKGNLTGEGTTAYLLLNDGVTLLIITIN
ncbi:MAG: hypothetical protein LBS88_04000 [Tannerellaceae bacterium]|jgi:hypothetical protein|nr:hypothetical protein [Tannerellaceae bacterium]